jgi:predicted TPR repeat methyltransferase
VAPGDYLRQVGKTVNGAPISQIAVDALVQDIAHRLAIKGTDHLLDLCCGNGLVTHQCAPFCRSIVGVDYSEPLLQIAATYFA